MNHLSQEEGSGGGDTSEGHRRAGDGTSTGVDGGGGRRGATGGANEDVSGCWQGSEALQNLLGHGGARSLGLAAADGGDGGRSSSHGLDPGGGDTRGVGDNGDRGGRSRGSRGRSRAHNGSGSRAHNGGRGGAGGNGSNGGRGAGGLHGGSRAVGDGRRARGDGDHVGGVDSGLSLVGPSGGQAGEEGNGSSSELHCDCMRIEPKGLVFKSGEGWKKA